MAEELIQNPPPEAPKKTSYLMIPKWLAILVSVALVVIVSLVILALGAILLKFENDFDIEQAKNSQTPTVTATVTPAKTVPTFPISTNSNLIRFTSEKLGVSFTYLRSQQQQMISAQEIGNRVYVYFDKTQPTTGQYLVVMDKDKNQTLEQAIKTQILKGYSENDCIIKPQTQYVPKGFNALMIVVPVGQDESMESIQAKAAKCPAGYTAMGGMAYFVEDPSHPDKMIFLSIGQYLISSEGDNQGWQNTLQLF